MTVPPSSGWPDEPPRQPQYGPPTGQQPYAGQQPYVPQAHWPQQPPLPPPPTGGGAIKWLLVAIAVLLVIGVTISATLLFTRSDGGGPSSPPTSGNASDLASANDTGPVSIITEEPTCKAYVSINSSLADVESRAWGDFRDRLGNSDEWTEQQRQETQAVANAMSNAAEQVVSLSKQTPHRLMRELYEQFIHFSRAYAEAVKDYTPSANELASSSVNAGSALNGVCSAIDFGSASRSLALEKGPDPQNVASVSDPTSTGSFITDGDAQCNAWIDRLDAFTTATPQWQERDGAIAATEWTPERKALEVATAPKLAAYIEDIRNIGR